MNIQGERHVESMRFDNRVAVVTGAGRGLGRCHALELARRGARVVVNDLGGSPAGSGADNSPADETVAAIRQDGGEAIANYDSVANPAGGAAIIQAALDAFGTVDILINNAGFVRDRSFANLDFDDLRAMLDVHLASAFYVTQPAFRVMKEKRYGRVLFVSSSAGVFGNFGQSSYGAAKMGVVGLSNVLAVEGARYGITSNVLAPVAKSRLSQDVLGPLTDVLKPEFVTPLALSLVAEGSDITHEIFSACGSHYARVFVGLAPGWTASKESAPSVEDVYRHLAQIREQDGYIVPFSVADEMAIVAKALS